MADSSTGQSERRQVEADAEVVSRHLPLGYTAEANALSYAEDDAFDPDDTKSLEPGEAQDSLKLQGGDIHREIFKIGARAKFHRRSATFAHPIVRRSSTFRSSANDISHTDQQAPGGFRREFMSRQRKGLNIATNPVTRDFVSFLDLYGSFAGEDLDESEDESVVSVMEDEAEAQALETRPLLGKRILSRREARTGNAGTTKSFFTLLKAFVGTGIMFLPKAHAHNRVLYLYL